MIFVPHTSTSETGNQIEEVTVSRSLTAQMEPPSSFSILPLPDTDSIQCPDSHSVLLGRELGMIPVAGTLGRSAATLASAKVALFASSGLSSAFVHRLGNRPSKHTRRFSASSAARTC